MFLQTMASHNVIRLAHAAMDTEDSGASGDEESSNIEIVADERVVL
jgi:hypothetical protein